MVDDTYKGADESSTATVTATSAALTLVMIVDLTPAAIEDFQRYEDVVLPLLPRHGGQLERRLRSTDQCFESHLITFESAERYEAFIADPDRAAARATLPSAGIDQRVIVVHEVLTGSNPALARAEPTS